MTHAVRGRAARVAMAAALALLGGAAPQHALALGNGQGSDASCTQSSNVGVTLNSPVTVQAGTLGQCPEPGSASGGTWGQTGTVPGQSSPPKGKPGDVCGHVEWFADSITAGPNPNPTSPDTLHEGGPGSSGQWFMDPANAVAATSIMAFNDPFEPFWFDGKFDANGNCVLSGLVQSLCIPGVPFQIPSTTLAPGTTVCWVFQGRPVTSTGLNQTQIDGDMLVLMGSIQRQVRPGQVSSTPSQAGLVNADTCFTVQGMNIPASQTFDITLMGPDLGSGRHIFFVFRVTVSFQGIQWDFGDPIDNIADPVPTDLCSGMDPAVSAAHRYHRYSDGQPGGAYQVTATETYGITAVEMWDDFTGTHSLPVTAPPPFPVATPAHAQRIIQEEGVPVGG